VWQVQLHRDVAAKFQQYGEQNPDFIPTFADLRNQLAINPKQFEKKQGKLKKARAAQLKRLGDAWRAVFTIDEERRIVRVLSLGPHDEAYAEAARRM
jgi:mRNA-degrading endonuclease RelE of RelBE toxin-antitoxin system